MEDEEKTRITIAINDTVQDLVSGFLYYDRKEDEELPRGVIESAIKDGIVTEESIVDLFASELRARLSDLNIFTNAR